LLIASVFFGIILLYLVSSSIYSYGFARKREYNNFKNDDFEKYRNQLPVPLSKIIKADDGIELSGDIYINNNFSDKKIAIIIHGYGFSRKSVIGIAAVYYNVFGYSVLLPDLRAHGQSGGEFIGFGWHDSCDILKWTAYLREMFGENVKIVLHGISMGGATALLTGAKNDKSVNAIISDCSYSSVREILTSRLKIDFNLPKFPFLYIIDLMMKIKCKFSINDGDVKEEVKKIKCPVLYIHGENDTFIPVRDVYLLYENTKTLKKLYICPNANHAESALINPIEYEQRVYSFLKMVFD